MTARWTFTAGLDSYTFEINPGPNNPTTDYVRSFTFAVAAGPLWPDPSGGGLLVKSEPAQKTKLAISGTILSQTEYAALKRFARKTVPVTVTDDLSRSFTAYLVDFQPKRVRKAGAPWYHTFTARLLVLNGI